MKYPIISSDPQVQAEYKKLRKEGSSHNIAEMCALQQSPGISGTDSQFWAATADSNKSFERSPAGQLNGEYYRRTAERMAPGCTTGAVYLRGLSPAPGHPLGWVKGRSDVVRALKARGCDSEGIVNFKAPENQRDNIPCPLAPDIVKRHVRQRMAHNPRADKRTITEQVLYDKTPPWKQKDIQPYLKQKRQSRGRRQQST